MMKTAISIGILVGCQLVGDWLAERLGLPLPGPVLGLALLLGVLSLRAAPIPALDRAAAPLLRHLSLLFIPAGTGVVLHLELLRVEWLPITAAIAVSTLLSLIITGLVAAGVRRTDSST